MGNVLADSFETYAGNLKLVLLFSIPFIIASIIPFFAPLPTYISTGAIFLRSASIFSNISFTSLAVIIAAFFFSMLFISFAFVAISLIVKSKRTHTKIATSAIKGIEKYIGKVLAILLAYAIALAVANVIGYYIGMEALVTGAVGFFGFMLIFYAPSAVVIDDKRIGRSVKDSLKLIRREPQYFLLWLLLLVAVVTILDFAFIEAAGILGSYIMLLVNSLFVLPYFVILMSESYMKKFPILKH